jgi:Tfp pilus assembly protein PilO
MIKNDFQKYGILLIVVLLIAKFVIQPLNNNIKESREVIKELESTYKTKYRTYNTLLQKTAQSKEKPLTVDQLLQKLGFVSKNEKDIILQVETLNYLKDSLSKEKLEILNFEFYPTVSKEDYEIISIGIRFKGNPIYFKNFLRRIYESKTFYKVTKMDVYQLGDDKGYYLKISCYRPRI